MQRWVLRILVVVLLAAFAIALASGSWLKQPIGSDDDVIAIVSAIEAEVSRPRPDWPRVEAARSQLKEAWQHVRARLQFVAEKDDIVRLDRAIDELEASVAVEDVSEAMHRLALVRSIWAGIR